MKNYVKGVITGFLIAAAIFAAPAIAKNIEAFTSNMRINADGIDRSSRGDTFTREDGIELPYSLIYQDTLYLSLRGMGEFINKDAFFNGDTNTVSVADKAQTKRVIAKKPDALGNVWEYAVITAADGNAYLRVTDDERGYSRVYLMAGSYAYVADDAVYFAKLRDRLAPTEENYATLIRLPFDNTPETQDGTVLFALYPITTGGFAIQGDYAYYAGNDENGSHITILNYVLGKDVNFIPSKDGKIYSLKLKESNDKKSVIQYSILAEDETIYRMELTLDKVTGTFNEEQLLYTYQKE